MEETLVTLSIDLKKYRLRLHKATYRLIGSPRYIQLLVNPEKKAVAVRAVKKGTKENQAYRIKDTDYCYEIWSRSFVEKLWELTDGLDVGCTYRLNGKIYLSQNTAVFPLSTLTPVER